MNALKVCHRLLGGMRAPLQTRIPFRLASRARCDRPPHGDTGWRVCAQVSMVTREDQRRGRFSDLRCNYGKNAT